MEQEETIKPKLSIWVNDNTLHHLSANAAEWKLSGVALDGYHGFGDVKTRGFEGSAALISLTEKKILNLSISSVHFSNEGFSWLLKGVRKLPSPPFLIADDPNTQLIFHGYIVLSSDQDVIDVSEPDDYTYSVNSQNWFGFITFKDGKTYLIAFSPYTEAKVQKGDELWSFEWDCSMGNIRD